MGTTVVSPALDEAGVADLAGRWLCKRIEGDFDAWMVEMQLGWITRSALSISNYGIGSGQLMVEQDGNVFCMQEVGIATTRSNFEVGAGVQNYDSEFGSMLIRPRWTDEGRTLHWEVQGPIKDCRSQRRYSVDKDELVVEYLGPEGSRMVLHYVRQVTQSAK